MYMYAYKKLKATKINGMKFNFYFIFNLNLK